MEERISAGVSSLEGVVTAQMLEGKILLRDITGRCMGARVLDSAGNVVLGEVVPQGSEVPGTYSKTFGLTGGGQGANTTIVVLEGKANMPASEATVLAEFPMSGLPAGPSKERIKITFTFSSDGVVEVKAVDLYSGMEIVGQVDVKDKLTRSA